jgi:hypothetical protein
MLSREAAAGGAAHADAIQRRGDFWVSAGVAQEI